MVRGFNIDFEKCTECMRCMIACSRVKQGAVEFGASRVFIHKQWPELPEIRVCRFDDCIDKPCIDACPVEAITNEDGDVRIDPDICTACGLCVEACPYSAIRQWPDAIAFKCDFCDGDPACVKECVTFALQKKEE